MPRIFFASLLIVTSSCLFAQLKAYEAKVNRSERMNFYLYTPQNEKEFLPLVVYLHGGGNTVNDILQMKKHGLIKLIDGGRQFPFYIFAPLNPYERGFWDDRKLDHMIDDLIDSLNVDMKRIYLVGESRGGYGAWRLAINHPGKYAALISICSANIPLVYLNWVSSLPVWFFHGEQDKTVPVKQSITAYESMKPINPDVKLTLYPHAGHDAWTKTFLNDEIYKWLLSHQLE